MKLRVQKSVLSGTVRIPASKSHTIRAIAVASLASGRSAIRNPLIAQDTLSAVDCYRAIGASIDTTDPQCWTVTGNGGRIQQPDHTIDVGNSGTTLRLAMGSAALIDQGRKVTFTGDAQIRTRPLGPLMEAIGRLGGACRSLEGNNRAPVEVAGHIRGGHTAIAAVTSQYLSSLLLCCPLAEKDAEIDVTVLNEPGYVQMTLDWLDGQSIVYENAGMRRFIVKGGQRFGAFDRKIGGDFSSATFFLCAGCLCGGEVAVEGLDFTDSQPDMAVIDYLKAMGGEITVNGDTAIARGSSLSGVELDLNATPDALPALAVTAAFARGTTHLVNVPQARSKETDRIACMAQELHKMGVEIEELPDGLVVHGGSPSPTELCGRGDHRIVMALSLAGMAGEGGFTVDTAEAVNVTFPDYVDLMKSIGGRIEVVR